MINIDLEGESVEIRHKDGVTETHGLGSPEAFSIISRAWLRAGWDNKYVYSFTWMGRPIIQLPEDLIRIQEVIYRLRPDVIVETGVAHGGSLVFFASLCKAMDHGRVIGVDIEIRPRNRQAIESHPLARLISLIEGSSTDSSVIAGVRGLIRPGETVLVLLDSCHTKQHVLSELRAYGSMVTLGSYIVACDGIMEAVAGGPRTKPDWVWNNPKAAALEFVGQDNSFVLEEPSFEFNEGLVNERITYWPSAFLKRIA